MQRVEVTINDKGEVSMSVENMHYLQLYGIAAVLHEQAVQAHHAHMIQQAAAESGGKLEIVRGMPGGIPT